MRSRHPSPSSLSARGFSMVELMATLAISSLVGAGLLSVGIWQTKSYLTKLAQIDAHGQAQVILNTFEEHTRLCGFGFGHANDAVGQMATGVCRSTDPTVQQDLYNTMQCSGRDNGAKNDRVQFAWITTEHKAYLSPAAPSAGPCGTDTSTANAAAMHLADDPTVSGATAYNAALPGTASWLQASGFASGMYIGGFCNGTVGPSAATDSLLAVGSPVAQNQCKYVFPIYAIAPTTGSLTSLSCPQGYAPGFAMGPPQRDEFYTDTDPTSGLPRLMMAQRNYSSTFGVVQKPAVVAVGVTRFEVRYGIDTSSLRDHKLHACPSCSQDPFGTAFGGPHAWCREARAADQGGSCVLQDDLGNTLGTLALLPRIVAVHITFDILSTGQAAAVTRSKGIPANAQTFTFSHLYLLPNMAT